jgi:hypothetical protein
MTAGVAASTQQAAMGTALLRVAMTTATKRNRGRRRGRGAFDERRTGA